METNWSRQKPFDARSLIEIQLMLMEAGIDVASATPIQEGLANSNYFVDAADGNHYVLRLHQNEPSKAPLLAAIGEQLSSVLPVPKMVFDSEEGHWSLFRRLPGRTMQSMIQNRDLSELTKPAHSIGLALARIASFEFEQAGELDATLRVAQRGPSLYEAYFDYCNSHARDGYLKGRISLEVIMDVDRCWRRCLDRLEAVMARPCLCHADFKASNILVEGDKLTGILDWEFAHAGSWLVDAGQILRYLGPHRDEFARDLESGMREGGLDVPSDWMLLSRVVDLMNIVDFLARPMMGEIQQQVTLMLLTESLAWIDGEL